MGYVWRFFYQQPAGMTLDATGSSSADAIVSTGAIVLKRRPRPNLPTGGNPNWTAFVIIARPGRETKRKAGFSQRFRNQVDRVYRLAAES